MPDRVDQQARCVVLAHPGGQPPVPLLNALGRRGVGVAIVHSPVAAMVEFALSRPSILVVSDPQRFGPLGPLLDAVKRYYPAVLCWQFVAGGGAGRLTKLDGAGVNGTKQEAVSQSAEIPAPHGSKGNGKKPKQAGAEDPSTGSGHDAPARDASHDLITGPLLTPEELDMLIGEAFEPGAGMVEQETERAGGTGSPRAVL